MVNEEAIQLVIADLQSQFVPNYTAAAKKFNINCRTLSRRHKAKTVSNAEARSIHQKLLTNAQEEILILHLNCLSARGMPPTAKIVGNIVKKMLKEEEIRVN